MHRLIVPLKHVAVDQQPLPTLTLSLPFYHVPIHSFHSKMVLSLKSTLVALAAALPGSLACLGYEGGVPVPTAHHSNSQVIEVGPGEVYDGGWARFDRGPGACNEQAEGSWRDAVFYLRRGATLRNVIIGANQAEGVHCDGPCTLEFVWFEDVCEDAISVVS